MNLTIEKTPQYHADVAQQFGWYFDEAGEELAWRFFHATDQTLCKPARQPELGRRRKFRQPVLHDLRSFQVEQPFQKILVFCRVTGNSLEVWRLMHGARNLSRRLVEPLP
jgi:plasmid stabilization system protein ParE